MLSTLWADLPGLRCVVGMRGKVTRHWWFETTEDAEAKASALDEDKWNVYYSPTLYDPARVEARQQETDPRTKRPYTGRAQDCAALLPALWLDLDCGEGKAYTDQAAALAALSEWQGKANVPPRVSWSVPATGCTSTGNWISRRSTTAGCRWPST